MAARKELAHCPISAIIVKIRIILWRSGLQRAWPTRSDMYNDCET